MQSTFVLLDNGSTSPDKGIFTGLPEGSTFTVAVGATTMTFQITYTGGSSQNSVLITRIN
jgi:hypothetical protein